jgi:hypothetical protein
VKTKYSGITTRGHAGRGDIFVGEESGITYLVQAISISNGVIIGL